ncbi:MAG: iron ABC transporter permease [Endomicrobium sp.]|jgi:iron complex transport system permease protein|nr:iron ABC transporter permease [Endomicrobium sp.]
MPKKRFTCVYLVLVVLLVAVFLFSLISGSNKISLVDALKALFGNADENLIVIIKYIRLPRILMSCTAGAGLAVSGCVFQSILRNPLADPFTLGISGGAAFGASVAFVSGLATITSFFVPICAFFGVFLSVLIVYLLSMYKKFDLNAMVLSGVVVSYIFSSAIMLMFALSKATNIQTAFVWLMGNISTFDEKMILFITFIVVIDIAILSLSGNIINTISLGGEKSKTLGIDIKKSVKILFLTTSFVTASIVSICGIIGFIGLMIPHIMRKIVGTNNVILIPVSAAAGAIFLSLCDTLSRILFSPVLIPVGVITSIAGGAFFIFLLLKSKKGALKGAL